MDRESLDKIYDTAIIGGGIVGSGLFRDQSINGKSSILIDQSDFNSQTSARSSKMLHGGIRYLENFDFALVFEALFEKNLWLKQAPHLVKESPFYLPVYKESKWPLFFLKIGLMLYDLLSLYKNTPHQTFSKKSTQRILPGIKSEGLRGSGMYFDAIVDDAKLGMDCIFDALQNSDCDAINYHKVIETNKVDDIFRVDLECTLTSSKKSIYAKNIIIATGPFIDQTMKELQYDWTPVIMASKGSHLWLKKKSLQISKPMVLQTKDQRIIFVIPQRNAILVGTTEVPLDKDNTYTDMKASKEEIDYLLSEVNTYFPDSEVTNEDIINTFAGVRPLVKDGHSSSKISRKHKTYKLEEHIYAITGGKYTTFRKMAQELNQQIFKDNDWNYDKTLSLKEFKATSIVKDINETVLTKDLLDTICKKELVRTKEDLIQRRLSILEIDQVLNIDNKTLLENYNL